MKHVRIDEGVKRGRRKRRSSPWRRSPETGMLEAIPSTLNPDYVLHRYLHADTTSQVARELGIRRTTLNKWMRDQRPEEWRAVQIVRADMRKEDGNEGLYSARDALELSRARELIASARWELTALDPQYMPKQEVTHVGAPILTISIVPVVAQLPQSEHVLVQQLEQSEPIIVEQPEQLPDKG